MRPVRRAALGLLVLLLLALPAGAVAGAGDPLAGPAPSVHAGRPRIPGPLQGPRLLRHTWPRSAGDAESAAGEARQAEADERRAALARLLAAPRPPRDPIALASRLAGQPIPWMPAEPFAGPLAVGRRDTFFVLDQSDNQYKPRPATLRLVSEHAYWYVQDGRTVRDEDLATTAQQFDQLVVPTVRQLSGLEWLPGIDGDARMTIFIGSVPGVAAYFSSWDEYPRTVFQYSNEREMLHIDANAALLGSPALTGTLAHEYQHMVTWHQGRAMETWLDEGFAEVASARVRPGTFPSTGRFQRQPNVQLTAWAQGSENGLHYQVSYLFARYLVQRFGDAAIGGVLREPTRPPESITAYLSRAGHGVTFEDVFQDWLVANLLDDPAVGDGRYAHDGLEHRAAPTLALQPDAQPAELSIRQFGAQYVELTGGGADAELVFEGAPAVRLVGADATSGQGLWWSNRGDGLETSLTRRFDLRGVGRATLHVNLWYDTERDFDFLYVLASTDGGQRWQVLRGAHADDDNPTGNAVGPGYSGRSGVPHGQRGEPSWIAETVDLSPVAGHEALIAFVYVTDQGYNARGVLIDDVAVPEIGYRDDAETDADWSAEGFVRSGNAIPQPWSVQLVEQWRGGQTTVRALRVDADGRLVERLPGLGGDLARAVLVVSGLAPRTLEPAPFRLTLRPAT